MAAVKDINIDIADNMGQKYWYRIDIGNGDIDIVSISARPNGPTSNENLVLFLIYFRAEITKLNFLAVLIINFFRNVSIIAVRSQENTTMNIYTYIHKPFTKRWWGDRHLADSQLADKTTRWQTNSLTLGA